MKTRIITAVVALAVFVPFLYFSGTHAFTAVMALLALIAAFEFLRCTGVGAAERKDPGAELHTGSGKKTAAHYLASVFSFFCAAGIPLCVRLCDAERDRTALIFRICALYVILMLCTAMFSRGSLEIRDAAVCAVCVMYSSFGFASALLLRDGKNGEFIYLLAFILPWVSDTFAYFTGYFFGRHKLIPEISPKKTVEGAVGGVVFGAVGAVVYGIAVGKLSGLSPDYFSLAVVGALAAALSQCGDLIASAVKRAYDLKDYGNLLPGHGGIMDRFDSTVITASAMYLLISTFGFLKLFV